MALGNPDNNPLLERNTKTKKSSFLGTNPVLKKMSARASEFDSEDNTASYNGIALKTLWFLAIAVVGAFLCTILHDYFLNHVTSADDIIKFVDDNGIFNVELVFEEGVLMLIAAVISLFAPLCAWLIRPTIPVAGTLYALCEGYFVGMITVMLDPQYQWASVLAFVLTVALVSVMLFLYARGIVKVTNRMRTIISAVFLSSLVGAVVMFILSLIPFTRPMVQSIATFMGTPVVSIVMGVLYLIVASLMLVVDFDTITNCVERGLAKKLEWMAAWGLAYTIIYIYIKILQIILEIISATKDK